MFILQLLLSADMLAVHSNSLTPVTTDMAVQLSQNALSVVTRAHIDARSCYWTRAGTLTRGRAGAGNENAHFMPAGVSRPLPTLMLVMLSFSASRLAKRLSGAGVNICKVSRLPQSRPMPMPMPLHMHMRSIVPGTSLKLHTTWNTLKGCQKIELHLTMWGTQSIHNGNVMFSDVAM